MMNEIFEMICRMTQKELKEYVTSQLFLTHKDVYTGDGFVFAKGTFPVLLVAHLDTVHKEKPEIVIFSPADQSITSPQGIGGDDRCGVFMIFEILKSHNCSVLFCEDEEVGGVGARKFIQTDLAKSLEFNYAIEFDRKGSHDAVFYDCDNEDFEEFITKEFYKTAWGSFSDISVVAPFLKCAAVNLSCGYYKAHTTDEFVVIPEMLASINAARAILDRTTKDDKFEYIEAVHSNYYGFGNYGYYGGYYREAYSGSKKTNGNVKCTNNFWYETEEVEEEEDFEMYYLFEFVDEKGNTDWWEVDAASQVEALGYFCLANPNVPYANIIDIMVDDVYGYRSR